MSATLADKVSSRHGPANAATSALDAKEVLSISHIGDRALEAAQNTAIFLKALELLEDFALTISQLFPSMRFGLTGYADSFRRTVNIVD